MELSFSVINYFLQGGVMMYFILLASIIGTAIAIERYVFYKKLSGSIRKIFSIAKEKLESNQIRELVIICDAEKNVASNILKVVLENYIKGASKEDIENSIDDITKIEFPVIKRYLYLLGTMVTISPMLGLLGTVLGMIKSTSVLAEKGLQNPSELLGGIAEALITTAFGLIVAIPLAVVYNYLVNKSEEIIEEIETNITQVLLTLSSKSDIRW